MLKQYMPDVSVFTPERINNACKTTLVYFIAEAFALCPEEIFWTSHKIKSILEPMSHRSQIGLPIAVKQELLTNKYSDLLNGLIEGQQGYRGAPEALQASVQDWSQMLASSVRNTYSLRPLEDLPLTQQFAGILTELGVGASHNPRYSVYLPSAVRSQMK